MELVHFQPLPGSDGHVTGYLHTPITEMAVRRERFPTVVLCPGGAYIGCSLREADPVALRFFARGYQVFTLIYSTGEKAKDFQPLKELSETFRLIREKAADYWVDPERMAVCGFSAGGHLAASLGTLWNDEEFLRHYDNHGGQNRPNAMVLCYPVITADEHAHVMSLCNVSGCQPGTPGYEYFSLDKHVSQDTCPAFLWHTMEDDCVPVENSLKMLAALHNAGVPAEAHFFPHGGHGMSVCTQETGSPDAYNARWMDLCLDWLTTPLAISCKPWQHGIRHGGRPSWKSWATPCPDCAHWRKTIFPPCWRFTRATPFTSPSPRRGRPPWRTAKRTQLPSLLGAGKSTSCFWGCSKKASLPPS